MPLEEEEKFNAYFWAAISYNFKSDLYEYRISTNNNGKMSAYGYRDWILNRLIRKWLDEG